ALEPNDLGVREPLGDAEQPPRRGTREPVDRLVVVADDAQVVAVAEPELEQRLLEQVHILVFVDGERTVPVAEHRTHALIVLVEPHGELEQVLEVDLAARLLAQLVLLVDARHQVLRDRRLGPAEPRAGLARPDSLVLGPLDLRGEVGCRPGLERRPGAARAPAGRPRPPRPDPPPPAPPGK